ncbi:MAG: DUF2202 domain-containing protein [Candidatus Thiodiazotropha sp. 6PLUC2]
MINQTYKKPLLIILLFILFQSQLSVAGGGQSFRGRGGGAGMQQQTANLDFNEATHLIFMREEEKLARDVYTMLGMMYPNSVVFGRIDDSEQVHTDRVRQTLEAYGVEDPNTNDNLGIFTGESYGEYFTDKYDALISQASSSELNALYVGALIEELDMLDIQRCPDVILEQDNGIDSDAECGLVYTDQPDVENLYESLLRGSANHLRGYVRAIEAVIGEGAYAPQLLSQADLDEILGR